jgi:deferrochelatase/peroxidase EfeB
METPTFLDNDLRSQPDDAAVLAQLQGNILRGYRRLCSYHAFIRFSCSLAEAGRWVQQQVAGSAPLAPTTASEQEQSTNATTEASAVSRSFLITAEGLRYFGKSVAGMCPAFVRGSRHEDTLRRLNDPLPSEWPDEYRSPRHVLLMLAGNDEPSLKADKERLLSSLQGLADVWFETGYALGSDGQRLSDVTKSRHEHFGFRDGLSQPVYLQSHWRSLSSFYASPVGPDDVRDPRRPLTNVLVSDPLVTDPTAFGSYVVYRKLQQDVTGFRERLESYVATLTRRGQFLHALWGGKVGGRSGYDEFASGPPSTSAIQGYVLSRMMGRSLEAVPVVAPNAGEYLNDFDFADDTEGRVCPFSAHVRKMNPRGQTGDLKAERARTLTRRSWPFGVRDDVDGRYKQDVGLLFFSAQASIENQFEEIQRQWANGQGVDLNAVPTPSIDSVIGQRVQTPELAAYAEDRHRKISETIDVNLDFYDLVSLRGAEYLFVPSTSGIRALSNV